MCGLIWKCFSLGTALRIIQRPFIAFREPSFNAQESLFDSGFDKQATVATCGQYLGFKSVRNMLEFRSIGVWNSLQHTTKLSPQVTDAPHTQTAPRSTRKICTRPSRWQLNFCCGRSKQVRYTRRALGSGLQHSCAISPWDTILKFSSRAFTASLSKEMFDSPKAFDSETVFRTG